MGNYYASLKHTCMSLESVLLPFACGKPVYPQWDPKDCGLLTKTLGQKSEKPLGVPGARVPGVWVEALELGFFSRSPLRQPFSESLNTTTTCPTAQSNEPQPCIVAFTGCSLKS